jgi:alanine racemase
MPRTWIEISRDALHKNIAGLKNILEPGVVFCAVLKSFAYGHGIVEVATVCKEEGITHFAVDSINEAEHIRVLMGEDAIIFLLGAQVPKEYDQVIRTGAIQTVSSADEVELLAQAAERIGRPAQITFEIETGLHRLGAQERAVQSMVRAVERHAGKVYIQSVASHLASSEDLSAQWETKRQNTIFCDAINWLQQQNINPPYRHIACSASTLLEPTMQHTLIRSGIMLYGLWPSADARRQGTLSKRHIQLTPALSWKTHLVHMQDIPPGAAVGYGGTFKANRPMRIGIIPVGYYDGFDRGLSNQGYVLVRGARCPILGRVFMNMCAIDVGGAPAGTKIGDTVTLIGRDGLGIITADEIAQMLGTITYEVVTRISQHIPRILV